MAKRVKSMRFVSRGGDKLDEALSAFGADVEGMTAADLGANVGGFTDCLLQRGVARVYAVDTGYGVLAWKLRQDPRVIVMERTNVLHTELPETVHRVVIDAGWTPMARVVPKALEMICPTGEVFALLKPQYEAKVEELRHGVVPPELLDGIVDRVLGSLEGLGVRVIDRLLCALPGAGGNREVFLRIRGAESL